MSAMSLTLNGPNKFTVHKSQCEEDSFSQPQRHTNATQGQFNNMNHFKGQDPTQSTEKFVSCYD